jgi:diguanylate cyclase (GGDEF)-like protein
MLEVLLVCTAIFVGLGCGWWLRGNDPRYVRIRTQAADSARTREVVQRLRELTRNVASDVDKHKALMGRISEELHASDEQQPAAVLKAVDKLIQFNERMQQQLNSAEEKLEDQARQIANHSVEALTDALTGLANRRAFDRELSRAYRASIDRGEPTIVMMIDVDHFKSLNDTYGHQAGDEVLRGIADVVRERIPDEYMVARYGGEEFAVIFTNSDINAAEEKAEMARRAIGAETFEYDGLELHVTASAGVAQFVPGETATSLLGRADSALYASKENGRDCAHFHDGTNPVLLGQRATNNRAPGVVAEPPPPPSYDIGISSPAVFSTDLRRRLADWQNGGAPLCVLLVQIDDLEMILDQHGEDNCEAMRRALTLTVKATMREIDHAARFAGQALSMLLPGATLQGAVHVAERLRTAVSRIELPQRHTLRQFSVSIGVAEAQENEDEEQLIERVRDSLTVAHMHGRNCTYVHDGLDFLLIGVGSVSMST